MSESTLFERSVSDSSLNIDLADDFSDALAQLRDKYLPLRFFVDRLRQKYGFCDYQGDGQDVLYFSYLFDVYKEGCKEGFDGSFKDFFGARLLPRLLNSGRSEFFINYRIDNGFVSRKFGGEDGIYVRVDNVENTRDVINKLSDIFQKEGDFLRCYNKMSRLYPQKIANMDLDDLLSNLMRSSSDGDLPKVSKFAEEGAVGLLGASQLEAKLGHEWFYQK